MAHENEYGDNMVQSGMDNDKVRQAILENEEHLKKTAAETIRLLYIIKAIGEKEELEASEEEIRDEVGFNVIREKVFKILLDSAKIKEVGTVGGEEEKPKKKSKKKK